MRGMRSFCRCSGLRALRVAGAVAVRRVRGAFVAATSLLAAAALSVAMLFPTCAFADDGGSGDNLVNPQQRPDSSFIYESSISNLANADSYYDKQTVQVTGEAVGDKINADGGMAWITLADQSDPNSSVAVLMTADAASNIDTFGRYGSTGSILQVRGQFNLTCSEHEGASDLHAQSVVVVKKGSSHPDALSIESFGPGVLLVVVGLALMVVFRQLRERLR